MYFVIVMRKWLVTYADVALNGTKVILHDYSPEIGKALTIYCFSATSGILCMYIDSEMNTFSFHI